MISSEEKINQFLLCKFLDGFCLFLNNIKPGNCCRYADTVPWNSFIVLHDDSIGAALGEEIHKILARDATVAMFNMGNLAELDDRYGSRKLHTLLHGCLLLYFRPFYSITPRFNVFFVFCINLLHLYKTVPNSSK